MRHLMIIFLFGFLFVGQLAESAPQAQFGTSTDPCVAGLITIYFNPQLAKTQLRSGFAARRDDVSLQRRRGELVNCGMFLGLLHHVDQELDQALQVYEETLAFARPLNDPQINWNMAFAISAVHMAQYDFEQAEQYLDMALPYTDSNTGWTPQALRSIARVTTHNNYAYVYALQGKLDQARTSIAEAEAEIGSCQNISNRSEATQIANLLTEVLLGGIADEPPTPDELIANILPDLVRPIVCVTVFNNIGEINRQQGMYPEAHVAFAQSLDIIRTTDQSALTDSPIPSVFTVAQVNEGMVLNNIGLTFYSQQQYDAALEKLEAARQFMRQINDPREAAVLTNIGGVYVEMGEFEAAERTLREAVARASEPQLKADAYAHQGNLYFQQGNYLTALQRYEQARALIDDNPSAAALILSNIAGVYLRQARYADARALLDEALETLPTDDFNRVYILNTQGAVAQAQGDYAQARSDFDAAYELAVTLNHQPLQAATLSNRGTVYRALGLYRLAREDFQTAHDLFVAIENPSGIVVSRNNLATVELAQGNADIALQILEATDATFMAPEINGILQNNRGAIYQALGDYTTARSVFEAALAIYRGTSNRYEEAQTLNNLGNLALTEARYGAAIEYLTEAQDLARQLDAKELIAKGTVNIGSVYLQQGRTQEAIATFEVGLEQLSALSNQTEVAIVQRNLAAAYLQNDMLAEAEAVLQQSLVRLDSADNPLEASRTRTMLGVVAFRQEKYAEAQTLLMDALALQDGDPLARTRTLANLGATYLAQEDSDNALTAYQEAEQLAGQLGARSERVTILANLGFLYESQGNDEQALSQYEAAMTLNEEIRSVAGSEQGRIQFAAQTNGLYEQATHLYYDLGRLEEALATSERGRARAFLDSLQSGAVQLEDVTSADLLARERAIAIQIGKQQSLLAVAKASETTDATRIATIEGTISQLTDARESILAEITANRASLLDLIPSRGLTFSLADLQAQLAPDETVISYYMLGNDETLAFVIRPTAPLEIIELGVCCSDLRADIQTYYNSFNSPTATTIPTETMYDLYRLLIAPVESLVETEKITVIPHRVLHYLPFNSLVDSEGSYLGARFAVTTAPSLAAYNLLPKNELGEGVVVLSNPDTGSLATSTIFRSLDNAELEVEAIQTAWADQVQVFAGAEASEQQLEASIGGASIVQVIAHGIFSADQPFDSYIAMTPTENQDGFFTVGEVYDLALEQTDLVVLSACETSMEQLRKDKPLIVSNGDDVVALNRAFLSQGVSAVLSTLWTVDDAASAELVGKFHQYLSGGDDAASALRKAQADIRQNPDNPDWQHPYYWAGFVLAGNVSKKVVPLTPTPSPTTEEPPTQEEPTRAAPTTTTVIAQVDVTTEPPAVENDPPSTTEPEPSGGFGICGAAFLPAIALVPLVRRRRKKKSLDGL